MVPKQCPLLKPTFLYLIRCATCLGLGDNSNEIPYTPSHPHTHMTEIEFSSIVRLRLRAFGAQPPSELMIACIAWFRRRQCCLSFLHHCLSSELRVGYRQYSRAFFALSATYFGIFSRRALVRNRTSMILCLSNARSGDLHFGTPFVALRALVREIIPNTIPTYICTYMTQVGFLSIVWPRLRAFGAQPPSEIKIFIFTFHFVIFYVYFYRCFPYVTFFGNTIVCSPSFSDALFLVLTIVGMYFIF